MSNKPYPNPIHLSLLGIRTTHDAGYGIERHGERDGYVFEFFESPVMLRDSLHRRLYPGNVFILYAPGQRQNFRADGPLTHTWFRATGKGVAECVERYQIPVNRAVEATDLDFLVPLLEEALRHQVRKHPYWEDAVTDVFRRLFRRLSRALYQPDLVEPSPYRKYLTATMYDVRTQVYRDLKRRWTVDDMAALASMSVQRFAVEYRACFGTRPIDDLIDVRLRHADLLLRHLPITVVDAAHHSGFNTGSNFHVLFRERMGRSPRELSKTPERGMMPATEAENLFETSEAARRAHLFYIRPLGHWSLDGGEALTDGLGRHPPAIPQNGVQTVPGHRGGAALQFDGTSHVVLPETVLDTSRSYTVCAWLAHRRSGRMTALSIGTAHHGAFYLQYISYEGGFKFAVTVSERDPLAIPVVSATPTADGEWHHVVGVHDAKRREIQLYVNGRLEGRTPYETPWRADDGATFFGCCQLMDTIIDHWFGAIDDVRMYDEALSEEDIGLLYRDADGRRDETGGDI